MTFVLGMLKNPDAQRLGQSEIDHVVGTDRLPSFEDKEYLPYVHAICEETLRLVLTFISSHHATKWQQICERLAAW